MVFENVVEIEKCMTAHMKPHTFDQFGFTSIIEFLKNIKLAFDTDGILEGQARGLFLYFIEKSISAVLNPRLSADRTTRSFSRNQTV